MKLVQISDPHLVAPGKTLMGLDPFRRLDACLSDVEARHGDADLVLVSGDLSDSGGADTYALLKQRLAHFSLPVRLLLGNHDHRAYFAAAFPGQVDGEGFAQAAIDLDGSRILVLDTLDDGRVGGRLCPARLRWLRARLAKAEGRPVYVFMHHPAGPVHMPALDPLGLAEPEAFLDCLRRHGDVRHIFAGHLHRLVTGHWGGVPFTILRGTNHQTALDLVSRRTGPSFEAPAYAVIEARVQTLVVHFSEF
ncbi:phosphodiesterase [Rhizobiaceae bacterium BDR2-2]|uniref:Phosphodiesterase n=1 Tax=Ectorhizobium quercum TaxID=2965071 RepID=A0AAE3N1M1_9HYPH|nr:phosphodiesterase [Ectorhizobium quercum]MCX8998281.1 phosphodiesterase [Ectorhizobium quercum]